MRPARTTRTSSALWTKQRTHRRRAKTWWILKNLAALKAVTSAPKILVSYRRADSAAIVGRIYDRLIARYGPGTAFLDIDSIPFATDFRDLVRDTLQKSDAVLAVVGPRWRGVTEDRARIMDDDDPVRVEIETALAGNIPVFPLLVDGATMPSANDLPKSIERFAFLNAATIDSGRDFHHHVDGLIASLDASLGLPPAPPPRARPTPLALVRSPVVWAILALLAAPTAASFAGFAPPWPPGAGPIAGVLAAAAFAAKALWLRRDRGAAAKHLMVVAALALAIAGCGYLIANSAYVFQAPSGERLVMGFVCTPEARALYRDKCPNLGLDELRGTEYEPERLWTAGSITLVRVELDTLWLVAFAAIAGLMAGLLAKAREPVGGRS